MSITRMPSSACTAAQVTEVPCALRCRSCGRRRFPTPRRGSTRRGRTPFRVGAVQHRWHPDPDEHRAALAEGVALAAAEGAQLVCLQELTLSPYFAITETAARRRRAGAAAGRTDARVRVRARGRARRPRPCVALRGGARRRARVQHRDRRRARRRAAGPDAQAAPPGHRGLPRGPVLPRRRHGLPGRRGRRRGVRVPDVLGPVVPRARAGVLARRRRGARLPDRHRLGARPSRTSTPSRCGST